MQQIQNGSQQVHDPLVRPLDTRSKYYPVLKGVGLGVIFLGIILFIVFVVGGNKVLNISDYDYPTPGSEKMAVIVGTNDLHGYAYGFPMKDPTSNESYVQGGLANLGSMLRSLFTTWGDSLLWLDAGDQFQGGIESGPLISSGETMIKFYEELGLNFSSIGNHEFDFNYDFLVSYMNRSSHKFLAANLEFEGKNLDQEAFLPNSNRTAVYVLGNGIKLGLIGLSTVFTPSTTSWFKNDSNPKFLFKDYAAVVTELAGTLREQDKVNAVIVVSHVGNACPQNLTLRLWDNLTEWSCPSDEISQLLDELTPGTVQAVVAGHVHQNVHYFYKGVPVIQSVNGARYFNILYLYFDQNNNFKKAVIEGPVPVCSQLFDQSRTCPFAPTNHSMGKLVNYKFHGRIVDPDPQLQRVFQEYDEKMKPYRQAICEAELYLEISNARENDLGDLVTDCLSNATGSDFAVLNPGGFRAPFLPGTVTYQSLYNCFPFKNQVVTFNISGAELLDMIKVIQAGSKGFYQTSKLNQIVGLSPRALKSIRFLDGREINPSNYYTGASIDFLIQNKGDDFANVSYVPRDLQSKGMLRQTLRTCFSNLKTLRAVVNPGKPRLVIEQ